MEFARAGSLEQIHLPNSYAQRPFPTPLPNTHIQLSYLAPVPSISYPTLLLCILAYPLFPTLSEHSYFTRASSSILTQRTYSAPVHIARSHSVLLPSPIFSPVPPTYQIGSILERDFVVSHTFASMQERRFFKYFHTDRKVYLSPKFLISPGVLIPCKKEWCQREKAPESLP